MSSFLASILDIVFHRVPSMILDDLKWLLTSSKIKSLYTHYGYTHQLWNKSKLAFLMYHITFSQFDQCWLTNDLQPPSKTLRFSHSIWYINLLYVISPSFHFRDSEFFTSADLRWLFTSAKNNMFLVVSMIHMHYTSVTPSMHSRDIVSMNKASETHPHTHATIITKVMILIKTKQKLK